MTVNNLTAINNLSAKYDEYSSLRGKKHKNFFKDHYVTQDGLLIKKTLRTRIKRFFHKNKFKKENRIRFKVLKDNILNNFDKNSSVENLQKVVKSVYMFEKFRAHKTGSNLQRKLSAKTTETMMLINCSIIFYKQLNTQGVLDLMNRSFENFNLKRALDQLISQRKNKDEKYDILLAEKLMAISRNN